MTPIRLRLVRVILALIVLPGSSPPIRGADAWPYKVQIEVGPDRHGKPGKPVVCPVWIPPDCKQIKGVIVSGGIGIENGIVRDAVIRKMAGETGLACMRLKPFPFSGRETIKRIDAALAKCAEASGHPELPGIAILTFGHSTGGIYARNVAYEAPERMLGVIHVMSGNLQEGIPKGKSLATVPFLGINGEFEACGPEGGLIPEYDTQTQWIVMRQRILERREQDPAHLMSLLVNPGGGHGSWSGQLAKYCALFIRKAVECRVPAARGKGPVRCHTIKPESGWLTDANLKAPQFKPAPYAKYAGDANLAFWHFDEATAMAAWRFHHGRFKKPDPSWKPLDAKAVAAFNLARTRDAASAVDALLALSTDPDVKRRVTVCRYLGRLGEPARPRTPDIVAMFADGSSPEIDRAVIGALTKIFDAATPALREEDPCQLAGR